MAITHIVAFKYKPETSEEQKKKIFDDMLALKTVCKIDGKPYIVSSKGGLQDSPEGHDQGMQHVFVVEFEKESHRQHYLNTDEDHSNFGKGIKEYLSGIVVVDFTS